MSGNSTQIRVALDWTPNPLHAGLLVALTKGFYAQAGLEVILVSPSTDNYATTPAKKLALEEVEFALCPSESIVSLQTTDDPVLIKACAALLNRDASAIVSRTASRPTELVGEGKKYASYGARYEDAIVQAMIDNDALKQSPSAKAGQLNAVTPAKLGIWDAVINGDCDSTWIFEPFEGIQAKRAGYDFKTFRLGDYDIPYGYSPCIAYNADSKSVNTKAYKAFLTATGQGYLAAAQDTEAAAAIVQQAMIHDGIKDEKAIDLEFLKESQKAISDYYNITEDGAFGYMQNAIWEKFVDFLKLKNLLKGRDGGDASVDARALYTNSLLEAHEV